MTKKRDRLFAGFGALLFLVTASTLTIAVIVNMVDSKNNPTDNSNAAADTTKTPATNPANKLQGTQMQNFTPISHIDKLEAQDLKAGTGEVVKPGDTVTVDYTGAVAATGVIFQSSLDTGQPATFGLDQVIKGWTDGIPGMKVGGERRLLIPAALAYGGNPPAGSGIPVNADLVFDVTLHSIGK